MTTATKRFNRPTYPNEDLATNRSTIAHFAPPGTLYSVVRVLSNARCRMRLYAAQRDRKLCRIDSLVGPKLFEVMVGKLAYDADKIDYDAFDNAGGGDCSGFGWHLSQVESNVPMLIVYTLAEVVHGDRSAWRYEPL